MIAALASLALFVLPICAVAVVAAYVPVWIGQRLGWWR